MKLALNQARTLVIAALIALASLGGASAASAESEVYYSKDAKGVIRHRDLRGKELDAAIDALLAEMADPAQDGR